MPAYRYLHLDVFTGTPFEGNQLAVFPEPEGLDSGAMQTITREMNFSECTFIFPAERGGDRRMRIFTPGSELPMAGHPTIGSTFALAIEGVIEPGRPEFVFELGVGPTPVALEWEGTALRFAWMTQLRPTFGKTIADRAALAAAIGVDASDLAADHPAQVVSCGVPFLIVPLQSRAAVDRVGLAGNALLKCGSDVGEGFFFTMEGEETTYSRMLAPGLGVPEDPATGSAAGPLGCYLLHHGLVSREEALTMVNLQGVSMKRPSRIHISIESAGGAITRVRVGGQSVLVGHGELFV